jgi:O-antigen/teichoic acid export membrane protein
LLVFVLDFGLSPTLNRVLARSTGDHSAGGDEVQGTAHTLSIIAWSLAGVVGLILIVLSFLGAHYWINSDELTTSDIVQSLIIMSVASAIQFPNGLYAGGLAGLQKQVLLNTIQVVSATLKAFGSIVVLLYVSPTIQAFLIWQAIMAAIQTAVTRQCLNRALPSSTEAPKFAAKRLTPLWKFAAGNAVLSIIGLIGTQADKLVASKMVSLEEFGYYSIAVMVCTSILVTLAGSIQRVSFPLFTRLASNADTRLLARSYHQHSQLVSALVIPTTLLIVFFSYEIMFMWTGDSRLAVRVSPLLSIYAVGTGLTCLIWIPNALQLAYGWTRLTIYVNLIAMLIYIPSLILAVRNLGAVGGALCWLGVNAAHFLTYVGLMHRRILIGEALNWYIKDVGRPLFAALIFFLIARVVVHAESNSLVLFIELVALYCVSLTITTIAAPLVRRKLFSVILPQKSPSRA